MEEKELKKKLKSLQEEEPLVYFPIDGIKGALLEKLRMVIGDKNFVPLACFGVTRKSKEEKNKYKTQKKCSCQSKKQSKEEPVGEGPWYLKDGTKIELGDIIVKRVGKKEKEFLVNKKSVAWMLKAGILTTTSIKPEDNDYTYLKIFANKARTSIKNLCGALDKADVGCNTAGIWALLRVVAIEIDKKYPDHISNSAEIFTISMVNGGIVKIDKDEVRNWRTFPAFRTVEDAKTAKKILEEAFNAIYRCPTKE